MQPVLENRPQLIEEEFYVRALDPGIQLYVRNRRAASVSSYSGARTVLFVHGATYPAGTSFDLNLAGTSWMQFIAERGFDVYLTDLRGYGKSTRPREMSEPADRNPPIVGRDVALRDIAAVVDAILKRREITRLTLLGWSWGASLAAGYAAQNPLKLERLILCSPRWFGATPHLAPPTWEIGAYRTVERSQLKERWLEGVPEGKKAALIPPGWFDAWADATMASDPGGLKRNPPVLRAPNGVLQDRLDFWQAGKAPYDPELIMVPTLLVTAEWDHDTPPSMAQALFPLLKNAPHKRLVALSEGTHMIMLERNRWDLFNVVQQFLEETWDPR